MNGQSKTKTNSQTDRTNQQLPARRGKEEGQYKGMELTKAQATVHKTDKQQGYIIQHRELQPLFCSNF